MLELRKFVVIYKTLTLSGLIPSPPKKFSKDTNDCNKQTWVGRYICLFFNIFFFPSTIFYFCKGTIRRISVYFLKFIPRFSQRLNGVKKEKTLEVNLLLKQQGNQATKTKTPTKMRYIRVQTSFSSVTVIRQTRILKREKFAFGIIYEIATSLYILIGFLFLCAELDENKVQLLSSSIQFWLINLKILKSVSICFCPMKPETYIYF